MWARDLLGLIPLALPAKRGGAVSCLRRFPQEAQSRKWGCD